jgi:alpha-L-fucosidase 2
MVLQSHVKADGVDAIGSEGYIIHLLPALPKQWPEGEFEGLRARGGYICDIFWKEGKLEKAIITSSVGGTAIIRYGDKNKQFKIKKGQSITLAAKDFSARGQDRP